MPTLPDSFGLVRLLSLLQSASMLTHVVQAGMQRASEWGIARGYRQQSSARCLIHSTSINVHAGARVDSLISKAHLSTQFPPASISAHRIEDRIEVVFRQPRISRLPR